jgi:anti-sigma factor RsiW
MNCHKARRWFGAYWDDEITQAERECLESHFNACPRCHAEYEALARTLESVAALPRHEAEPDFVERTLARARRAAPAADRLREPRPAWAPLAVAASLAIAAVVALVPRFGVQGPGVANRAAHPQEARLIARVVPGQPATATPAPSVLGHARPASQEEVAALVDSLIDHTEDVDFVLDPVHVSRERTAGRRVAPVQGQQAVITF